MSKNKKENINTVGDKKLSFVIDLLKGLNVFKLHTKQKDVVSAKKEK